MSDLWRNRIIGHEDVAPDQLLANPYNWRLHVQTQQEAVEGSLDELGWIDDVTVNVTTGHVLDGHLRVTLALRRDEPTVPVKYVELSEEEERLALAVYDPSTAMAATDREKLGALLQEVKTGDGRLQQMLAGLAEREGVFFGENGKPPEPPEPQVDRAEELQAKWQVESGQVWQAGEHYVMCGDCREPDTWERLLSAAGVEKVNGVFTSPPYAEQRKQQYGGVPVDEYVDWWQAVQANVRANLARDGSFFVNIKPHCEDGQRVLYVFDLVLAMVRWWEWRFVDELCWPRPGVPGKWSNRFKNGFEPVYQFCISPKTKFKPQNVMHHSAHAWRGRGGSPMIAYDGHNVHIEPFEGEAWPSNLLPIKDTPGAETLGHAAPFPVSLPDFFIRAYSDAGDVWLDPFLGSGTTIVAAHNKQRRGLGIEKLEKYVAVTLERLQGLGLSPQRIE